VIRNAVAKYWNPKVAAKIAPLSLECRHCL
jgi:hypothetical protein